jgi:probable phosphoglycerate mutase
MMTHLLRHGRTAYSQAHRLNGDPGAGVLLDGVGWQQCQTASVALPLDNIASWVSSTFPRALQTVRLLRGSQRAPVSTFAQLNELNYGDFEGQPFHVYAAWLRRHGPRARPPGGTESQHEGISRMLEGLRQALQLPGPRLVVTHGLLLSVLAAGSCASEVFFPEAGYLEPVSLPDPVLTDLLERLGQDVRGGILPESSSLLPVREPGRADTFGPTFAHQEEEDSHA